MIDYAEYQFEVSPLQPGSEILMAELAYAGFDSFVENERGLSAYIAVNQEGELDLNTITILQNPDFTIHYKRYLIKPTNWNKTWEKNFSPITVDHRCCIRAGFHDPQPLCTYDIVIDPKMSFGTGHHATTHLMVQYILDEPLDGKNVLDMGCGTAVLAILAKQRGATSLIAVDIDDWAYLNALENVAKNKVAVTVMKGTVSVLDPQEKFDLILANINRNVLLSDLAAYTHLLKPGSSLILSGFYQDDEMLIVEEAKKNGLTFVDNKVRDQWIAARFYKNL